MPLNAERREARERSREIERINLEITRLEHEKWLAEHGYFPDEPEVPPSKPKSIWSKIGDMLDTISSWYFCILAAGIVIIFLSALIAGLVDMLF